MLRIRPILFVAVVLLGLALPVQAQLGCQYCTTSMPCNFNCYWNGNYNSTCIQSTGVCNRDPDADGVDWLADNCPTTSNANQADCDGDRIGDVCDPMKGIFVPSGPLLVCASDIDNHVAYNTSEVTYQQRHVDTSACHSPDRWNHTTYSSYCPLAWSQRACCEYSTLDESDASICTPIGQYYCNPDTI